MNCDGVRVLLSAYLDGELSSGELLHVEQHLRRCHSCADDVDSLRQTIALVASMDEVVIPATFHAQLHNRLVALGPPVPAVRRIPVAPGWQRNLGRWAVPAAAAAAALAVGLTSLPVGKDRLAGLEGNPSNFSVAQTPQVADNNQPRPVKTLPPSPNVTPTASGKAPGPDQTSPPINATPVQPGGTIDPAPAPPSVGQPPVTNPGNPVPAPPVQSDLAKGTDTVPAGTGGTAVTTGPDQPPPAQLTPKTTISSDATVTTVSADNVTRALAAFRPRLDGDIMSVTVSADRRRAVEEAVKHAAGVQVVSGFTVVQTDLSGQIHSLEGDIAFYRQQLEQLEKQIPKLKGQEQEDALAQHKVLSDKITRKSVTLDVVNGQVDMAIITVHIKVQGQ